MNPEHAEPVPEKCTCGAPLRFETRERFRGRPWLALCSSETCGQITAITVGGVTRADALQHFLVGGLPPVRYIRPWTRFFIRSMAWGYAWSATPEACHACHGELSLELRLTPRARREADPYAARLCLDCGATGTATWIRGESVVCSVEGEAWDEPVTQILVFKRALAERAAERAEAEGSEHE